MRRLFSCCSTFLVLLLLAPLPARSDTGGDIKVVWDDNATPMNSMQVQNHILIPLNEFVLLGLAPRYNARTKQFTLTAPNGQLKGQIGKTTFTLNAVTQRFAVAPQLATWKLVVGLEFNHFPFVPLEQIARWRGYTLSRPDAYSMQLRAPHAKPCMPITKFGWQKVAPPSRKPLGELVLTPELNPGSTGGYVLFHVKNGSKRPYQSSKVFIFVEMRNGTILSGDDIGGSWGANPGEQIEPGKAADIGTDPLSFPAGYKVPIWRIWYADGVHFGEWQIKEYPPHSRSHPKRR